MWDNRSDPALLAAGASDWPYQVDDVSFFNESDAALRPPGFDPALEPGLALAKTHCLTCHKVNGYGGEKAEGNLAAVARGLGEGLFIKWALDPQAVQPDATMPALATQAPEAERRAIAELDLRLSRAGSRHTRTLNRRPPRPTPPSPCASAAPA